MAYTYLEIVNLALREVNEVPLTGGTFDLSRGLQQFARSPLTELTSTSATKVLNGHGYKHLLQPHQKQQYAL